MTPSKPAVPIRGNFHKIGFAMHAKHLFIALAAFVVPTTLQASAFIGGTVNTATAVPPNSPLKVRMLPKPTAAVWTIVPHGANISLTGPCRRYNAAYTAVLATYNLHSLTKAQGQAKMSLPRVWCAVWVEKPSGSFSQRWVHANYVTL